MDILAYLKLMADKQASDLFLCTGTEPRLKIQGVIRPIGSKKMLPGEIAKLANALMTEQQCAEFASVMEMNFAIPLKDVGRFRVNVFRQRGEVSIVIRYIKGSILKFDQLNLPDVLGKLVTEKHGLILVVGAPGSGKSTTVAAMIEHRNQTTKSHILTIEDPLEFIHSHAQSIVQQREIGMDTLSYENALKNALREAPDVILIGEIRDVETMKHAISYAETGQLCLATLHANNAHQALDRIISFFPESARQQLLTDLSLNLRAIVSQRLLPSTQGGMVPAVELMLSSPLIVELISTGAIGGIKDAMKTSSVAGTITFDQALLQLFYQGKISMEEALRNADSKNDVSLDIRMNGAYDDAEGHNELIIS